MRLRVNTRARRVSLRIDAAAREVLAIAPSRARLAEAIAFAESRADWIASRLDGLPQPLAFTPGAIIPLAGQPCRLERAAMRIAPRLIAAQGSEPARLLAYGEGVAYARAVERALRAEALRVLTARTAHFCQALATPTPAVSVMDARARWGSCRPAHGGEAARIRYVWRLILAPPEVADYVAAHECAHLIEANHGPRFWALNTKLVGDVHTPRAWLREHGPRLHAVGGA